MALSAYDSDAVFDTWLESRVAAFEEALRHDPQASPAPLLAACPDESARAVLAGELARIMGEARSAATGQAIGSESGLPPARIGPFRLGRQLGQGGFGRVFEAWDERLERPVALKLMRDPLDKPGGPGATFLTEARAVSRLRHPSIVVLFDVGEFEGLPYLVYERIEGTDLKAVLASGPLPADEALAIAAKIGLALAQAHDRGIVHRDVKPSNVLIDTSGEPFLTDFGLSGPLSPGSGDMAGSVCGTLPYMAPEQAEGEQVTFASDVYGLGAVLYECLTGQPPFSGTARMVRQGVVSRMPEPPSRLIPGLDDRLDRLVLKALAKAPGDRYASVRAFVEEIEALAGKGGDRPLEPSIRRRRRPGQGFVRYAGPVTVALGAFCGPIAMWPGSWRPAGLSADVRTVLTESATLARERMASERDRRFREAELAAEKPPATDFAAFYRTLLTVGERLPKPVRARFQLDCATACRNAGDLGEATNRLIEAAALADSALKDDPEDAEALRVRLDIARVLAGWSDLPGRSTRRRIAEAGLAVDLSERFAGSGGSTSDLAYDLISLGNLLRSAGAATEADEPFVRALAILKEVPADTETPQAVDHLRQQYLMAQALRGSGRRAEALSAYRLAGMSLAALPEAVRTSEYWLDIDADGSFHQARLMRESGDPRGALPLIDRAVGLWSDLAKRLNSAGASQFDLPLAHSRNAKGAILADLEETEPAIVSFDGAIGHYRDVLRFDPDAINARRGLANVLHTSARLSAELGRLDDAKVRFEEAIGHRRIIASDPRSNVSDRVDLAVSCQAAGEAKVSIGQVDAGLEALRVAVDMFRDLESLRPDDRSLRQRSREAARFLAAHSAKSDPAR